MPKPLELAQRIAASSTLEDAHYFADQLIRALSQAEKPKQKFQSGVGLKSSPLRSKSTLKGGGRIKPVSEKRQKVYDEVYLPLRSQFLASHPFCECDGCPKPSVDVHHKKGRVGNLLCDTRHWMAVCRLCHGKIEQNPVWAKEMGYSLEKLKQCD